MLNKNTSKSKYPKVLIDDWLKFHPYETPVVSDYFYLRVCNEVHQVIHSVEDKTNVMMISEDEEKELSCMLTAWFEDLISETRIYLAFIEQHYKLYNKYLPFYSPDDYYPGEINSQDVQFLIWYFLSEKRLGQILISPESNVIEYFGNKIFGVFDKYWETAPENPSMKAFLQIPPSETDFYAIRFKIDWLVLNSYLFFFYGEKCTHEKIELLKKGQEKKEFDVNQLINFTREVHDNYVHNTVTSLLAYKGKQWLAYILGEKHPLYIPLLQMSDKKSGMFLYLGYDDKNIHFRHIASGYEINVTRNSFDVESSLEKEKSALLVAFVQWMNEWWFSGTLLHFDMSDDILLEETSDPGKADLFADVEKKKQLILEMYAIFLKYNHQKPIAFFKSKHELQVFMDDIFMFYNQQLAEASPETTKKYDEHKKKKMGDHFPVDTLKDDEDDEGLLIFFSSLSGFEIAFGLNQIIPDENNVHFNPSHTNVDAIKLIAEKSYSHELVKYLTENYQIKHLKLNGQKSENLIFDNLDFLSRLHRRENYYSVPHVTMLA